MEPRIEPLSRVPPPHFASQEALLEQLPASWSTQHFNVDRNESLQTSVQVEGRHLALQVEKYPTLTSLEQRSKEWIRVASTRWVAHTGGPKVLRGFETARELPEEARKRSWPSPRSVGNLSSASVLFVLLELLESNEAKPRDYGLLLAMGPGFCAEARAPEMETS